MRRKDREMDREFAINIIDKSKYGIISMIDEDRNEPYGIPLSIVRYDNTLYFHSSMEGRKVGILSKGPKVNVTFVGEVHVPEVYSKEELEELSSDESKAVLLISNVFTTEFESAIVVGKVELIEDEEKRIEAMRLICEKYTPSKMDYFHMAIKAGLKRTNVYKIEIEEISAKRKKYGIDGKEMKMGKME